MRRDLFCTTRCGYSCSWAFPAWTNRRRALHVAIMGWMMCPRGQHCMAVCSVHGCFSFRLKSPDSSLSWLLQSKSRYWDIVARRMTCNFLSPWFNCMSFLLLFISLWFGLGLVLGMRCPRIPLLSEILEDSHPFVRTRVFYLQEFYFLMSLKSDIQFRTDK